MHVTIDTTEVKSIDNIDLDLCVPNPNDKLGDRNNLWLESWRLIHYNLAISITIPRLRWTDKYALYSSNGIRLKSKQDFINVVTMTLNNNNINNSNDNDNSKETDEMKENDSVKQIEFVIKV